MDITAMHLACFAISGTHSVSKACLASSLFLLVTALMRTIGWYTGECIVRSPRGYNSYFLFSFSLPDGTLTTYDSYPERCLPDGRVSPDPISSTSSPTYYEDDMANPVWSQPLGWWFAIRIAWPNAIYPSPDNLMQKMVRLHRPMQLGIDNSVAAAGIWRNLLMGSRAERNLDLARLRDLISTETANLRQRKQLGKLTIGAPRPNWEDMN